MAPNKKFKKGQQINQPKKKFRKPSSGVHKSNTGKQMLTVLGTLGFLAILVVVVNAYRSGYFSAKEKTAVVKEEKKNEVEDINKIRISEATWGANCDGGIKLNRFGIRDQGGNRYTVEKNNVLDKIKELCEMKKSCEIDVTSDFLGLEPAENCAKVLTLKYRCFSYDKTRDLELLNKASVEISCEKKAP